jgi:hypothetical protein
MDNRSKQFSKSRDTYYRTVEKSLTQKHNASEDIDLTSHHFDHKSDFEEYLKAQCHELVCEV